MLRTEFRMSAREAWDETPSWEVEALLRQRGQAIAKAEREARSQ